MSLVTKVTWRHFALIILVASVVRGGVLLYTDDLLTADPDAYRRIARCIAMHGTFGLEDNAAMEGSTATPTAFRPPLYPWLMSRLAGPDGNIPNIAIALTHWLLGTATAAGTYWLALRLLERSLPNNPDGGERPKNLNFAATVAAVLVTIDPLLLQASSVVMTETLATGLVVLVLCFWCKLVDAWPTETSSNSKESSNSREPSNSREIVRYSLLIGIVFGLAYLCRPTFILWPVFIGTYLLAQSAFRRCKGLLIAGTVVVLVVAAFVSAWTFRNMAQFGRPIWATTHGGYTLLLGNNPPFYEYVRNRNESGHFLFGEAWDAEFFIHRWEQRFDKDPREASFWDSGSSNAASDLRTNPQTKTKALSEIDDDSLAYETAVATIKRQPNSFLAACIWRLRRLHSPFPLQTSERPSVAVFAVGAFYMLTMTMALIGIWRLGRTFLAPHWAASIALWVAIASVHTVYWTDMRMRAPAIPILSILAAVTVMSRPFGTLQKRSIRSTTPANSR